MHNVYLLISNYNTLLSVLIEFNENLKKNNSKIITKLYITNLQGTLSVSQLSSTH